MVPFPRDVLSAIAPGNLVVQDALRLGARPAFATLSIDSGATARAAAILAAVIALYWSARRTFAAGGIRQVCRAIGWLGLLEACVALVQLGASRNRIYGFWTPLERGTLPFGSFVNRNHAATWLLMAIPLSFGYLVARLRSTRDGERAISLRNTFDGRTVWLIVSTTAMLLALAVSLSRSGIVALFAAAVAAAIVWRSRLDRVRARWIAAVLGVGAIAIMLFADPAAVLERFGQTSDGPSGRFHIWRDTLAMCRALLPAGSGIGTFQTAMLVFQTGDRTYYFNHAHNHFLQAVAEGGLLMSIPAGIGLVAFVAAARARMGAERTGLLWIRAGAAAGLFAAAIQSLWETGLRIPANAALAAVLAAILTHRPRSSGGSTGRSAG